MYAVSSEIGCTALNGAMAVDIPAGGQSVILALDKKIVIDGDDAAKFVEVRWGTNTAVSSRPVPSWISDVLAGLISIVGDDNFDFNYIPAENKLYLQFALEVTNEQIAEVKILLEGALPSNVVTEIDEVPMRYTRLEYLESTGTQYITTVYIPNSNTSMVCTAMPLEKELVFRVLFGARQGYLNQTFTCFTNQTTSAPSVSLRRGGSQVSWFADCFGKITTYSITPSTGSLNNLSTQWNNPHAFEKAPVSLVIGAGGSAGSIIYPFVGRIYSAKISEGTESVLNFIPCLDDEGTPCMFDTVSRTPYYNKGTGDFTYPDMETQATTYSLRNRMYAQYTEHGIRRLYNVPEGYSSKEEYAEENGFKLLVETPMPEEGYWTPVWREREDCIELEWIEAEPPAEELQIEEIENA